LLAEELPNRIGAPLSVKNLKELLQVAHETVERWLKIFERMYYVLFYGKNANSKILPGTRRPQRLPEKWRKGTSRSNILQRA